MGHRVWRYQPARSLTMQLSFGLCCWYFLSPGALGWDNVFPTWHLCPINSKCFHTVGSFYLFSLWKHTCLLVYLDMLYLNIMSILYKLIHICSFKRGICQNWVLDLGLELWRLPQMRNVTRSITIKETSGPIFTVAASYLGWATVCKAEHEFIPQDIESLQWLLSS